MYRRVPLVALMTLTVASLASGQDMQSGPEKGKPVPTLKVFDATGANEGKEVDYATERKGRPTVYAFVRADRWDRPMARFLRKLDDEVQKKDGYIVAVWLTEDVAKTKTYLPVAQRSLQLNATALTCYPRAKETPNDWRINSDAHLTVVVAAGKVTANFGYQSVNETDVPAVMKAFEKVATKR